MYKRHFLIVGLTALLGSLLLSGCNNGDTASDSSSIVDENITKLLTTNECEQCDLSGADLSNSNLRSAKLFGANLSDANLSHSDLYRADLHYTNLQNANLQNAYMKDADLKHADLRDADLRDADLTGADLNHKGSGGHFDADLRGAIWIDGEKCEKMNCEGKAY